jgi:hypothetical protein
MSRIRMSGQPSSSSCLSRLQPPRQWQPCGCRMRSATLTLDTAPLAPARRRSRLGTIYKVTGETSSVIRGPQPR